MSRRTATTRVEGDSLLLGRSNYRDADLILTLFSQELGRVSALARGARKSTKRFSGSLEPMHTLRTTLEDRGGSPLLTLKEASLARPRLQLTTRLDRLEAAGTALRWIRRATPTRAPDSYLWASIVEFLDQLDTVDEFKADSALASHGMAMLRQLGWGLSLEACAACGKACADGKAAMLDVSRGGLVCVSCGGGRMRLLGPQRERLARMARGDASQLTPEDVKISLELIQQVLQTHGGIDESV